MQFHVVLENGIMMQILRLNAWPHFAVRDILAKGVYTLRRSVTWVLSARAVKLRNLLAQVEAGMTIAFRKRLAARPTALMAGFAPVGPSTPDVAPLALSAKQGQVKLPA
jgi:hypothetical protein